MHAKIPFSITLNGYDVTPYFRLLVGQHVSGMGDVVGHVNISSVRVEDGGHYACTATNSASSVVHEAPLNVYGEQNTTTAVDVDKGLVCLYRMLLKLFCLYFTLLMMIMIILYRYMYIYILL